MRGPRKIDGTLQIDPENVRIIRGYMKGSGSAKDAVYIDWTTTDRGLYYFGASNVTGNNASSLAGVALAAWDTESDTVEQIVKIQVLGPVTDVNVATGVAIGQKLFATSTAGRLDDSVPVVAGNSEANIEAALNATSVGIAYTAEDSDNKADVYLVNPLGL